MFFFTPVAAAILSITLLRFTRRSSSFSFSNRCGTRRTISIRELERFSSVDHYNKTNFHGTNASVVVGLKE